MGNVRNIRSSKNVDLNASKRGSPAHVMALEGARHYIKATFAQGAATLRRLASPREINQLCARVGTWPDIVYEPSEHGAWEPPKITPLGATRADIDNLNRCLGWLWRLKGSERRVALGRLCGIPFGQMAKADGCSRRRVYQVYENAVTRIIYYSLPKV